MIYELLNYLNNIFSKTEDNYIKLNIFNLNFKQIGQLCWRQFSPATISKFNDDIVLWHKGSPYCFIRYEETNKKKYINYDEIVVNNETIGKTILNNDGIIVLFYRKSDDKNNFIIKEV